MTLYYMDKGGIEFLPHNLLFRLDRSLSEGKPSFQDRLPVTLEGFRQLFLGGQYRAYDYLLNSDTPFFIVTHPEVTFSCQDKIDMYNRYNCRTDTNMGNEGNWKLSNTIKAVYFYDKNPDSRRYHMAFVPGKPTELHIDQRESFRAVCSRLGINVKKRIRLFPADKELVFGAGLEGCLSPLVPEYVVVKRQELSTEPMIDAIFFDKNHLLENYGNGARLDDISIALHQIWLDGEHIEKVIGISHIGNLSQIIESKTTPLKIIREGDRKIAIVDRPIVGDYRDSTTKPSPGEEAVTLRFSYIPNHMLSALISYRALYELLDKKFKGKVFAVDMKYK